MFPTANQIARPAKAMLHFPISTMNNPTKNLIAFFSMLVLTTKLAPEAALAQTVPFSNLNPANNFNTDSSFLGQLTGKLLPIFLVMAGFVLLIMLIAGGFTMLTNPTNPEAQASGKQRITYAVAGFLLLFTSFWLIQILEIIFKLEIV